MGVPASCLPSAGECRSVCHSRETRTCKAYRRHGSAGCASAGGLRTRRTSHSQGRVVALVRYVLVPLLHWIPLGCTSPPLLARNGSFSSLGVSSRVEPPCASWMLNTPCPSIPCMGAAEHLAVHTWGTTLALRG